MPYKTWVVGEEVLAADFNAFVQKQVVATFPNAAARDAAIPAPNPGMKAWLDDVALEQVYDGAKWAVSTVRSNIRTVAYKGNLVVQAGGGVLVTNAGGLANQAFPTPFSAIPIVMVQNADSSTVIVNVGTTYANYFDMFARFNDAAGAIAANAPFNFVYIAVGII